MNKPSDQNSNTKSIVLILTGSVWNRNEKWQQPKYTYVAHNLKKLVLKRKARLQTELERYRMRGDMTFVS